MPDVPDVNSSTLIVIIICIIVGTIVLMRGKCISQPYGYNRRKIRENSKCNALYGDDSGQFKTKHLRTDSKILARASKPPKQSDAPIDTKSSPLDMLWGRFEDTTDPAAPEQNPGGVLIHNVGVDAFQHWNELEPFNMHLSDSAMVDCTERTRKTCSAWSYLRSDLMPVIFNAPSIDDQESYATPLVGIICDAAKLYPLITTLGSIDSDSNHRSCCSNQFNFETQTTFDETADTRKRNTWNVIPSTSEKPGGGNCSVWCSDDDTTCKYNNAGGTVDTSTIGQARTADQSVIGSWGTEYCSAREYDTADKCKLCSFPHICKAQGRMESEENQHYWASYNIDSQAQRAYNNIGQDGSAFEDLFASSDGGLRDAYLVGSTQCKFEKTDWKLWVDTIKRLYRAWLRAYQKAPGGGIYLEDKTYPFGLNYNLANPAWYFGFLENEVNLYVYPSIHPEKPLSLPSNDADLRQKQDKIFHDSVLGFFFVGSTCLEQLSELNGITTTFQGRTWKSTEERCFGYLCNSDKMPPDDMKDTECYQKNVLNEYDEYISNAKRHVIHLAERFNSKYRPSDNHQKVVACEFKGDSNTYLRKSSLLKLQNGDGFKGKDIFGKIETKNNEILESQFENLGLRWKQDGNRKRQKAGAIIIGE